MSKVEVEILKLIDLEEELRDQNNQTRVLKKRIALQQENVYIACQMSEGHRWVKEVPSGPRDNGEYYYRCTRCGLSQ